MYVMSINGYICIAFPKRSSLYTLFIPLALLSAYVSKCYTTL